VSQFTPAGMSVSVPRLPAHWPVVLKTLDGLSASAGRGELRHGREKDGSVAQDFASNGSSARLFGKRCPFEAKS
jgi:hypothetical protein